MAEPRWLQADEQRAWLGLIATMTLLDAALDRQLQRDCGLTHGQYAILSRLSDTQDRTMHMSDLALRTSSSQSRLSHAVNRLEEQGWVMRSRCPHNKRAVHATLTEAGFELVEAAAPGHAGEVRRLLFDQLTSQQVAVLNEITGTTLAVLAAEVGEGPLPLVDGGPLCPPPPCA
jgi:DNA-binding MarR family transcriptional regulator